MRVLLIDNQPHVREAMQFLLDQQPGISVVGARDTINGVSAQLGALRPDIILIQWEIWTKSASDLLADLRAVPSRPKLVVFSSRVEVEAAALTSGADAFLCVYDPSETFLNVLWTIAGRSEHEDLGTP